MPRYCAVKLCKNRGGIPSKDNKKISFYPFPLRDEARLQKWVDNMKREEWTPSRHQYLCSDHFTEDSFDLRWGIRYLKHTAVPTIFPFIYKGEATQDEVNKLRRKRSVKPGRRRPGVGVRPVRTSSPPRKRALILKREDCGPDEDDYDLSRDGCGLSRDDPVEEALEPVARAADPQFPAILLIGDLDPETASSCETARAAASLPAGQVVVETANQQPGGDRVLITSCVGTLGGSQARGGEISTVTVLCAETAHDVMMTDCAAAGLRSAQSGEDGSAPGDGDRQPGDSEIGLLCEHSYSRQNTDTDQLWSRIASLHLKITQLERREEDTVSQISALEALAAHLRRETLACEEKQRALEEYFSSVFL